jgi:hypothetical protein
MDITEARWTAPMAAIKVLLGLLPLHFSWRVRPEQEFTDSAIVINGNPNLKVWTSIHDSRHGLTEVNGNTSFNPIGKGD